MWLYDKLIKSTGEEEFSKVIHNHDDTVTFGYTIGHKISNLLFLLFATTGIGFGVKYLLQSAGYGFYYFSVIVIFYFILLVSVLPVIIHKDFTLTEEEKWKKFNEEMEELFPEPQVKIEA